MSLIVPLHHLLLDVGQKSLTQTVSPILRVNGWMDESAGLSLSGFSNMLGRTTEMWVRRVRPNTISDRGLLVPVCGTLRYVRRNSVIETAREKDLSYFFNHCFKFLTIFSAMQAIGCRVVRYCSTMDNVIGFQEIWELLCSELGSICLSPWL